MSEQTYAETIPLEPVGTPLKPVAIRCTSLGQPTKDSAYLSITTQDGRQYCFALTYSQTRLHNAQTAKAMLGWPADEG